MNVKWMAAHTAVHLALMCAVALIQN